MLLGFDLQQVSLVIKFIPPTAVSSTSIVLNGLLNYL